MARTAGLPLPQDRLASLDRREVRRFVRSLFDLVLDPRLLADPAAPAAESPGATTRLGSVLPAALRPAEPLPERHDGGTRARGRGRVAGALPRPDGRACSTRRSCGSASSCPAPDGDGSVLRATRVGDDGEQAIERTLPDDVLTFRRRDDRTTATALEPGAR